MAKVKAAGVFIVRKNGELLICHPTNHAKDFWSIPKGKIEEGESMLEAAIRETYEETNINLNELSNFKAIYLGNAEYSHRKKELFAFAYFEMDESVLNWDDVVIQCNSNVAEDRGGFPEMDDYIWVKIDNCRELLHETQAVFLDALIKEVTFK